MVCVDFLPLLPRLLAMLHVVPLHIILAFITLEVPTLLENYAPKKPQTILLLVCSAIAKRLQFFLFHFATAILGIAGV